MVELHEETGICLVRDGPVGVLHYNKSELFQQATTAELMVSVSHV